jgi:hypothetical protein
MVANSANIVRAPLNNTPPKAGPLRLTLPTSAPGPPAIFSNSWLALLTRATGCVMAERRSSRRAMLWGAFEIHSAAGPDRE